MGHSQQLMAALKLNTSGFIPSILILDWATKLTRFARLPTGDVSTSFGPVLPVGGPVVCRRSDGRGIYLENTKDIYKRRQRT